MSELPNRSPQTGTSGTPETKILEKNQAAQAESAVPREQAPQMDTAVPPGNTTLGLPKNAGTAPLDGEFSLADEVRLAAPGLVEVPGYEIVGELGRGGMGVVYRARQLGLNRWVALKMVLAGAHADQKQLARFQIE